MSKAHTPRLVPAKDWKDFLHGLDESDQVYFGEQGPLNSERDEELIEKFMQRKAFGDPAFYPSQKSVRFDPKSIEEKNDLVDRLQQMMSRDSQAEPKLDRIIVIAEEILLNGLISAPQVATEAKLATPTSSNFLLYLEWSDRDLWIHGQDPYGVFYRKNFCRSFGNMSGPTHGHSGRGLNLILDSATDLFIRSKLGWGTWVAARVDFGLSNSKHDREPKRLLLDFQ